MRRILRLRVFYCVIFLSISAITYSQNSDLLFTGIDQYKSYIFAKHLKPLTNNKGANTLNSFILDNSVFQKNELPIFCKMEFLINQKSQIPVKIRLGDIEYVDMLESKAIPYKVKQ